MDEMGFVYEKDAIFQWLSSQPGAGRLPVRAPIAGKPFPESPAPTHCIPVLQCSAFALHPRDRYRRSWGRWALHSLQPRLRASLAATCR